MTKNGVCCTERSTLSKSIYIAKIEGGEDSVVLLMGLFLIRKHCYCGRKITTTSHSYVDSGIRSRNTKIVSTKFRGGSCPNQHPELHQELPAKATGRH